MDQTVLRILEYPKVLDMLADKTGSVLGKELVHALAPVNDSLQVEQWLAETAEARAIVDNAKTLPLGGVRDIRAMVKRCDLGSLLEPHELLAVGGTLAAARRIRAFFGDMLELFPLLTEKSHELTELRSIENSIENTINEHGNIRDDASVELFRLRREIKNIQTRIKERIDSILHSSENQKYFQDNLVTIRGDRYVIPVKQEYRNQFSGIVHDQSASGATLFIEPMAVVSLNNDLKQAISAERNEIERILAKVSSQIGAEAQSIYQNCNVLGEFDLINAKALLSVAMKAERPIMNDKGVLDIRKGRHPLISGQTVVPIDLQLGHDFSVLLVTGPNTGGKTVSLKTAGLFALMAQSGMFIPAEYGSELPVYNSIHADIGDEQSIEQSLSTFSAHMTNLIKILNHVSAKDLVLMDEMGAGTDPDEGAALAMSILDFLLEKRASVIATTHYSELKTFAYARDRIENASVEFDVSTLRPTYRLLIGIPGSSNAFAISKRLGLNEEVIEHAKHFLSKEKVEFEEVLSSLQEKKITYSKRLQEIAQTEREVREQKENFLKEQALLREKRNEIISKAKEDAASLLRQTRRDAGEIIEQLKAQFAVKSDRDRQRALQTVRNKLKESSVDLPEDEEYIESLRPVSVKTLRSGDRVFVTNLKQEGTVISTQDTEITVQLGIMKINVPVVNCRQAEGENKNKKKIENPGGSREKFTVRDVAREVDVRGMNVEEAILILEKFLDDAILAGLNEVNVIHGKGTGALRKGLRAYLSNHPHVKQTLVGEFNQGGDGVTVVKLK